MNAPVSLPALRRRHWSALAAAALLGGAGLPLRAAGRTLPLSVSLPDELAQALAGRQPLVVMVSLHRCPWCEEVRNNYLAPMRAQDGLPVVQLDMLRPRATRDLQGAATTHDALVRGWGIKVTPTLLFVGPGGREVAPRLEGALLEDFYGAYLDDRLQAARKAVLAAA